MIRQSSSLLQDVAKKKRKEIDGQGEAVNDKECTLQREATVLLRKNILIQQPLRDT